MERHPTAETTTLKMNSDTAPLIPPTNDTDTIHRTPDYQTHHSTNEILDSEMREENSNTNKNTTSSTNSTSTPDRIPLFTIAAMLAPAFAWGFISTTLSLLTLPLESQRAALSYSSSVLVDFDSTTVDVNVNVNANVGDATNGMTMAIAMIAHPPYF